jgi:hypothetical protein
MKLLTVDTELAWAAGFLDGEGSFGNYGENKRDSKRRYRIQAVQVRREALDRLQEALGGAVRGPYGPYSGNRQPYYSWQIFASEAKEATEALMPYLCSQKREQAIAALEGAV